ncbi:HNH endonuclease [Streptomyces sp. ISL-11]|uniref:HNH endonuclease signature motif containing protein n=1 Tax=Streptomyces sp. ISL-11 TaxID=2819174 RepID=UPI001BE5FA8D|nr:HNH endonuclease [Streptomyces sp. ISL-11]MBT2382631.1 HNH endonuclease [Streptomyces sp. ISL-11]
MSELYDRETLVTAVGESTGWADLMRRLGVKASGGRRRVLQEKVAGHGIDTSHFKQRSPWRKYPDDAIAAAVGSSTTLREVVQKLGAPPATGTISHIRRRILAAGIDVSHFPGLNRPQPDLPFSGEQLKVAAASATSVRAVARNLGVPDDSRSRAALRRMLNEVGVDTTRFGNGRLVLPEGSLREAVVNATSFAEVMRKLGLPVNDTNHRRVRRRVAQLKLDTCHFTRKPWGTIPVAEPKRVAGEVLQVRPEGAPRESRQRLHRALGEIGVPYRCARCGNEGEWLGEPMTLQIDHINGDWLDNRAENLRYLCPNCHSLTETWCRGGRRRTERLTAG